MLFAYKRISGEVGGLDEGVSRCMTEPGRGVNNSSKAGSLSIASPSSVWRVNVIEVGRADVEALLCERESSDAMSTSILSRGELATETVDLLLMELFLLRLDPARDGSCA